MDSWRGNSVFPVPGQSAIISSNLREAQARQRAASRKREGSTVRIHVAIATLVLMFAVTVGGFSQQAAPQGGQGGQGGQGRGGGGGRGGRGPAAPALPTPRRPDGKPWIGSVPGQQPGRWNGGPTTLPQGQLDKIPFQPWAKAVYDQRQIDQFEPHTRCKASGVSRQFSTPYGTEFVDVPDLQRIYILDMGGPNSYRIIYMDGREHPKDFES